MARKKNRGIVKSLEDGVLNMVDTVSVAATGSQLGILERAAEEELKDASRVQPGRKKKKKVTKKPSKTAVRQKVIDAKRAKRSGKKRPVAKKKKMQRAKR